MIPVKLLINKDFSKRFSPFSFDLDSKNSSPLYVASNTFFINKHFQRARKKVQLTFTRPLTLICLEQPPVLVSHFPIFNMFPGMKLCV